MDDNIQEQQLEELKKINSKLDDLYREMREVKIRVAELNK